MSAIIADDEQLARQELKFLLDQIGDVEVVAVAATGTPAGATVIKAVFGPSAVKINRYAEDSARWNKDVYTVKSGGTLHIVNDAAGDGPHTFTVVTANELPRTVAQINNCAICNTLAKAHGVKVGAHPSLPDLQGFGRREMKIGREELTNCLIYQIGALKGFLEAEGMTLNHIKPHGSLYGMSAKDPVVATAIAEAASVFGVPLYGMSGTHHETHYARSGAAFVGEFYADLDYGPDGFLIITREHHAVEPAEAAARVLRAMNEGKVRATNGQDFSVRAQSVCVHSDTPNAVEVARAVRDALLSLQNH